MTRELLKKMGAEFLGTAVLVFLAVGAAILGGALGGPLGVLIGGAIAFGIVIVAMAYTIGGISGCHLNPAVSFGLFAAGKMKGKDLIFYIIAQIAGAIMGALILFAIFELTGGIVADSYVNLAQGSNHFEQLNYTFINALFAGLLIEMALTYVFVFVIIMVTSKMGNKKLAGIVIGVTLTVVHLVGIPLTGTSVNPARSFGTAVFAGVDSLRQVWVFLLAPMIGAVLAALTARAFIGKEKSETEATDGEVLETTQDNIETQEAD